MELCAFYDESRPEESKREIDHKLQQAPLRDSEMCLLRDGFLARAILCNAFDGWSDMVLVHGEVMVCVWT